MTLGKAQTANIPFGGVDRLPVTCTPDSDKLMSNSVETRA